MNLVKQVVKWLQDRKIFSRERKSNEQRAQGILLYHAGLSYEKAGIFTGVSYEAVREWYQKGKELFEASTKRKVRKWIAVDEKEIKINGTTIFIWGAVDIDDEKVMAVWVSFGRSSLEAAAFLKKVRAACDGRLPRVQEFLRWLPFHTILCHFNPRIKVFPFSLSYRPPEFYNKKCW
jgi:transposase-like protein